MGPSGEFITGTIDDIWNSNIAEGYYVRNFITCYFSFSLDGGVGYEPDQWKRPGFFHLKKDVTKCECTCGAEAVYGKNTRHASHCDKYEPNPYTNL